jgi:hypothetical protein
MLTALLINLAGLLLLSGYFVAERFRLERIRHRVLALRLQRGRRG